MATLSVTLISARDLVASDSGLEGSKSDPFVVFQVGKEVQQSSCVQNELNPDWLPRETFEFPVANAVKDVLDIKVLDYDAFNEHDVIGKLVLPVSKFMDFVNQPQHERFFLEVPAAFEAAQSHCRSVLELEICLRGDVQGECTLRLWENEVWSITAGWVPSDTEVYRRWSAYDDSVTATHFEDVCPAVPNGMEGSGWGYVRTNRSDDGWTYAYNFLGPFSLTKTLLSYVRRRVWENRCTSATDPAVDE